MRVDFVTGEIFLIQKSNKFAEFFLKLISATKVTMQIKFNVKNI